MQVSKNQIESARNANLADFFLGSGYQCERRGAELHVRGFGGLYVNTNTNGWYQFSEQRGGNSAVDCLTDVLGMDFTSAVSALSTEAYQKNYSQIPKTADQKIPKNQKTETQKNQNSDIPLFPLPINEHEKKRVFAYLCKERKIDTRLVQELVDKKLLYQGAVKYTDKDGNEQLAKGNAVFVQTDTQGNTVGGEIHGTNSFKRFKAIAGAGEENIFKYVIGTPKKV